MQVKLLGFSVGEKLKPRGLAGYLGFPPGKIRRESMGYSCHVLADSPHQVSGSGIIAYSGRVIVT